MIIKKKPLSSRVIAFVTAALIILYTIPVGIFDRNDAKAASGSASDSNAVTFPEKDITGHEQVDLKHNDKLIDNGNGTFTFTSEISASYSFADESNNRAKTQDGYVVINKPGSYLIEIWGGEGGTGSRLPLLSAEPGKGGHGGWVYGVLLVTPEMVSDKKNLPILYYEVGSNGKSITKNIEDGGSGGIGGGAGDITLISVGAGGGYSAAYLVSSSDINDRGVLKKSGDYKDDITYDPRNDPKKVLMIAGGGGGGGAGSSLLPRPVGSPNGGNGGTLGNLAAASSVDGFKGTYYAGTDGSSSGKKTLYTGKGGTDRPGEVSESVLGFFDASSLPNDWLRQYHPELDRGVGGAGNLRGGGGGAGFAGGSGGLQKTAVDAEEVGGGGGGSSYVTSTIPALRAWNYTEWDSSAGADEKDRLMKYFTATNANTDKDGNILGGSVIVRYLPQKANTYEFLNNEVTVKGAISDYFTVVDSGTNVTFSNENKNEFSLEGKVTPVTDGIYMGQSDKKINLKITLKPKDDFAGGNDVPIFSSDIVCTSTGSDEIKSSLIKKNNDENKTDDYEDHFSVTHVNVPFNYKIKTNSIVKKAGDKYRISDLIVSETYRKNEFMTKSADDDLVIPVTVTDSETKTLIPENKFSEEITATLSEGETQKIKTYIVSLTVNPNKKGLNSVGTPNAANTTISSKAIVQILNEVPLGFDGLAVNAVKNLSYNYEDDTYDLNVKMKFSSSSALNKTFYVYEPIWDDVIYDSTQSIDEIKDNQLEPGYYRVEAYGGDGGKGGDYQALEFLGGLGKVQEGSPGGSGGYYNGIIKISSISRLIIQIGKKGDNGRDTDKSDNKSTSGLKGDSTKLEIENIEPITATGGAGGDGAVWGNSGNRGENGTCSGPKSIIPPAYLRTTQNNLSDPSGDGAVRITKLGVKGGYGYGYYTDDDNSEYIEEEFNKNIDNISGQKELVETQIKDIMEKYLKNITISEDFSKYFKVVSVETNGFLLNQSYSVNGDNRLEASFDLPGGTIKTEDGDEISDYNPTDISTYATTRRNYSCIYDYTDDKEYSLIVKLKPVDGFLGGNDVPLLNVSKVSDISEADMKSYMESDSTEISFSHSGNTVSDDDNTVCVPRNDVTDWANVELDVSDFEFTVDDKTVDVGTVVKPEELIGIKYKDTEISDSNSLAELTDWKSDFVEFISSLSPDNAEKIYTDTKYTLTAGLVPKAEAKKAQVIASVSGKQRSANVTAYAKCTVSYNLVNLATDRFTDENQHEEFLLSEFSDEQYIAEITPLPGYRLPKTATVQGIDTSAYTVKNEGGKIKVIIPKEKITGNITISASGILIPHKVHYMYQRSIFTEDGKFDRFEVREYIDYKDYYKNVKVDDLTEIIAGNENFGGTPPGYYDPKDYEWIWPEAEYDADGKRVSGGKLKDSDIVVMGDEDLYVVGRFKEKTCILTIHYNDKDGTELYEDYVSTDIAKYNKDNIIEYPLKLNSEYSVKSPPIEGYIPDQDVVSGIITDADMKAGEKEITVTYYQKNSDFNGLSVGQGLLRFWECEYSETKPVEVNVIKYDREEKFSVEFGRFSSSAKYDVTYKVGSIIGDIQIIQIKQSALYSDRVDSTYIQNDKGITITLYKTATRTNPSNAIYDIYYMPKNKPPEPQAPEKTELTPVKVNFDPNGTSSESNDADNAKSELSTRILVVGESYGFIPEVNSNPDEVDLSKGRYGSLPKAVWKDHIFDGWYTEPDKPETPEVEGKLVDEESIVPAGDHTLYAHWKSSKVTITIHFDYADIVPEDSRNLTFPDNVVFQQTYNMSYEYKDIPQFVGFAPNMDVVRGVAIKDETINVLYSNEIKLFIKIYSSSYEYEYNLSKMPLLKEGKFSVIKVGDEDNPVVENAGEYGEISLISTINNNLTRGDKYIIRCTSPPPGFNTYEETFTLDDIVTEKTIFIRPSFELPFTGTTNQTIYYCAGAGTMFVAAVLLYITLKKEKRNDKK